MTTVIMRTTEGDMRMMLLLWDATLGNRSLKIVISIHALREESDLLTEGRNA